MFLNIINSEKISKDLVTIDADAQDSFASVQRLNDEVGEITPLTPKLKEVNQTLVSFYKKKNPAFNTTIR